MIGFSVTFTTRVEPCISITTSENKPVANSALQRAVGSGRIERLTHLKLKVRANRLHFGADVALNLDPGNRAARSHGAAALGVCRRVEGQNCDNGQYGPTKDQTFPPAPVKPADGQYRERSFLDRQEGVSHPFCPPAGSRHVA